MNQSTTERNKRTKFSELEESKKIELSKLCYDITMECKFRGSEISKRYSSSKFPSAQFILKIAQYYIDNYCKDNNEILRYIKLKNEYKSLSETNGIYYREDTKYQQYINEIDKIEDMVQLDEYIKGNNPSKKEIPLHSLDLAIADRTRALGDKDGVYHRVKEKLLAYGKYKYETRIENNNAKSKATLDKNIKEAIDVLTQYVNSNPYVSKKDFCREYIRENGSKITENIFEKYLSLIKTNDVKMEDGTLFIDYYRKTLQDNKEKYYSDLKPVVEDILNNIDNNPNYTIIDYYLDYKDLYTFKDLCESCNTYNLDIRKLKSFLSKVDVKNSLNLESFVNQYYNAYNHEFSDEEKVNMYNYAKENCIPFNWHNVSLLAQREYGNKDKVIRK